MEEIMQDLISVPQAANRAGVARNTMRLAAKNGNIGGIPIVAATGKCDVAEWNHDAGAGSDESSRLTTGRTSERSIRHGQ